MATHTCYGKIRHLGCTAPTIRYEPIEGFFLTTIVKNAERLFADTKKDNTKLLALRGVVGELENKINHITSLVLGGKGTKALVEAQGNQNARCDDVTF